MLMKNLPGKKPEQKLCGHSLFAIRRSLFAERRCSVNQVMGVSHDERFSEKLKSNSE
jgi:hypothetical protein